jgi:hypothetical protein
MVGQVILGIACALGLTMGTINASMAQPASAQPPAIERWADDFTVLTMAPDGAWGTGTDAHVNGAINRAINSCREMSSKQIGCGAYMTTVRGGWSLGIRCGEETILVAERDLAEAERAALVREAELRYTYARNMPPCRRIVTVDPNGNALVDPNGNAVVVKAPVDQATTK